MQVKELKEYLELMGYHETQKGEFSKSYLNGEDDVRDVLTITYKVKKEMVYVYYKTFNKKIKRFKGKLKNVSIKHDNSLSGLTQLA